MNSTSLQKTKTLATATSADGIARTLCALHDVTNTYGRELGGMTLALWQLALSSENVTAKELEDAATWWLRFNANFPTPADILNRIREDRANVQPYELRIIHEPDGTQTYGRFIPGTDEPYVLEEAH